jgi:hypothetical protein
LKRRWRLRKRMRSDRTYLVESVWWFYSCLRVDAFEEKVRDGWRKGVA